MIAKSMLESKSISDPIKYVKDYLNKSNFKGEKMLRIGGGKYSNTNAKKEEIFWGMKFYNLDFIEDNYFFSGGIKGDIINCPQIVNNSFDFIISTDTFEHIKEPWKATKEIIRILKPGGIVFISTIFAWRYHEVPVDYWRYSPQCLVFLFNELECLEANWDNRCRRSDYRGGHYKDQNDNPYNDAVPIDEFGGFRENWRVYYLGRKKLNKI